MRLIVGLGNPGTRYQDTPHNLGFRVVERLAEEAGGKLGQREAQARTARTRLEGSEVVLAQPQTFMNASGLAVAALLARYRLSPADLIVVADDVALPWGTLRIREQGSAGGHNGLASIIGALDSDAFVRVRVGIRPESEVSGPADDLADYVLSPLPSRARVWAEEAVEQAAEAVRAILRDGTKRAMTRFNRRVAEPKLPDGPAGNS
ncbi:MAG: aminoacyl-tRNA hydrolase [Acidobacteria bacterium]|nr:aminoacyl-tRNA hydrolase [Acidobacteriota bacterium]